MGECIKDLAIVLTIFDGYEDLWDDCIKKIKVFWKDHPPIYVFTNEIKKEWDGVKCFPVGKNAEWSMKARKAIEVIPEHFFILLLEDFFIGKKVNNDEIEKVLHLMQEDGISYCKLCENNEIIHRRKKKYCEGLPFEVIYKDEEYGISLQASLWNKEYFSDLLGNENYNAWVFELNQLKKTKGELHDVLYDAIDDPRNILNIYHGALQGKMIPKTVKYFERINMKLTTNRAVMSHSEYFRYWIKQLGRDIVPSFMQKKVKKIAQRFGMTFVDSKWS